MDRKSIALIVACVALILFWTPLTNMLNPNPHPAVVTNLTSQATAPAPQPNAAPTPAMANLPVVGESKLVVRANLPEQLLTVSNAEALYIFTSRGGGLKEIQLLHYPATISSRRSRKNVTSEVAALNDSVLPPVFSIYGDDSLPGDGAYEMTAIPQGIRAQATFTNGLTIIKDFQFGTNYLLDVSVRFENHSQKPLAIAAQRWVAGAATPMDPLDNGLGEAIFWRSAGKSSSVTLPYFDTNTSRLFGLASRVPKTSYSASNNIDWISVQNQFFTMATMAQKPVQLVDVNMTPLPPPTAEEISANPAVVRSPMALQAVMVYPGLTLAANQSVTNNYTLFAGPKEYQTLAQLGARFNNDIDAIMSFGWFGGIAKALLVTMNWFHDTLRLPYGWVIVGITVVLRMVLWPLTAASVRSSKRMQALQPEMKKLQEKYKAEPQKLSAKQWEFYKKNNVNPLSGCLPAFVQIPVFGGFYYMLRGAIELRGAPFLWIGDLSKPDTVFSIPLPLHLVGLSDGFIPINPMPLIMGATLLWGANITPPSPSMDASQQKMMKYMPLFMLIFMYNLSSGLALYWTVSNLLTVVQNKVTRMEPKTAAATVVPTNPAPQKKKKD